MWVQGPWVIREQMWPTWPLEETQESSELYDSNLRTTTDRHLQNQIFNAILSLTMYIFFGTVHRSIRKNIYICEVNTPRTANND